MDFSFGIIEALTELAEEVPLLGPLAYTLKVTLAMCVDAEANKPIAGKFKDRLTGLGEAVTEIVRETEPSKRAQIAGHIKALVGQIEGCRECLHYRQRGKLAPFFSRQRDRQCLRELDEELCEITTDMKFTLTIDIDDAEDYPDELELFLIQGGHNYADCDGIYNKTNVFLNGRPVYVCEGKSRFIGWCGWCWVLTGMQWHADIVEKQERGFGGFHASTNANNPIGKSIWENYQVISPGKTHLRSGDDSNIFSCHSFDYPEKLELRLIQGGNNYADCDGVYDKADVSLNGRPVYVCERKNRFIAWSGSCWTLTGMQWHAGIVEKQERGFGGFHASTNANNPIGKSIWENYLVAVPH